MSSGGYIVTVPSYLPDGRQNPEWRRAYYAKNRDRINATNKACRERDPERAKEWGRKSAAAGRAERRAVILEAKTRPCADCGGVFHPECMDFDHVRGEKGFNVGRAVCQTIPVERLRAEMAKCEVVCANCHRLRTARRAGRLSLAVVVEQGRMEP